MTVTVSRYDAQCYRLWQDKKVVGFALKLTNGRWGMFDANDKRLTIRTFQAPKDVAASFSEFADGAQRVDSKL